MSRRSVDWGTVENQLKTVVKRQDRKPRASKSETGFYPGDEWKQFLFNPQVKEDGTYSCVIRFLPRKQGESDGSPFIMVQQHAFQGENGRWFIDKCPETHPDSEKCPICNIYRSMYKQDQDFAKKRKAKKRYYANIMVVTDKINPDNEKKVFLMEIDSKMFNLIWEKMFPDEDSDEEAVMVADYDQGMDFRFKIKTVPTPINGKVVPAKNKDGSSFTGIQRAMTDEEYQIAEAGLHSLDQIKDVKYIKSSEQLIEKHDKLFGPVPSNVASVSSKRVEEEEDETPVVTTTSYDDEDDDDDDEAFLRKLRGED